MRTTIEIEDHARARLLEIAGRRGEKGFSRIVGEAVELYLRTQEADEARRRAALRLRATLSRDQAERLRRTSTRLRESWR